MNNKRLYLFQCIILLAGLFSNTYLTAAELTCQRYSGTPTTSSVSINAASYVGNELPVGSTLYRTRIYTDSMGISCMSEAYSYPIYMSAGNAPAGPSFSFNGMSFGSGQVYPTNVSGVGFVITTLPPVTSVSDADPMPHIVKQMTERSMSASTTTYTFDVSLIKTGPIASGSQVNASSFPAVIFSVPAQAGYSGLPMTLLTINFSGSVNFVTSTCTTPDVYVEMGTYSVSNTFQMIGSTTPWIDSSIKLTNCPVFSGYYNESSYQKASAYTGSIATGDVRSSNIMTVSLTPTTSVIDTTNGILEVNNSGSAGQAAAGVGIQLGYTPSNYAANPTTPTTIWKPGVSWDITPPNDGSGNINIPLAARYFQTQSSVTAGPANTKVTFNIDYK